MKNFSIVVSNNTLYCFCTPGTHVSSFVLSVKQFCTDYNMKSVIGVHNGREITITPSTSIVDASYELNCTLLS